jgi:hypothetical protein
MAALLKLECGRLAVIKSLILTPGVWWNFGSKSMILTLLFMMNCGTFPIIYGLLGSRKCQMQTAYDALPPGPPHYRLGLGS